MKNKFMSEIMWLLYQFILLFFSDKTIVCSWFICVK